MLQEILVAFLLSNTFPYLHSYKQKQANEKNYPPRLLLLILICVGLVLACNRKDISLSDNQARFKQEAQAWLIKNGKGYKNGILMVQAPNGKEVVGLLDWTKATNFQYQGKAYLSIPYMFKDYGIQIPGDAARQIPAVSFKIIIRRQGDTLAGALQSTSYGNTMENIETNQSHAANIQSYTGFDNKKLNTWRQEAGYIKPAYRSYLSKVEIAAIRKAARDRKAEYAKTAKANVVNGRPVATATAMIQECGWVTTYKYVDDPDCTEEETVTSAIDDGTTLPTVMVCSKRISQVVYIECPDHTSPPTPPDDDGGYPPDMPPPPDEDDCAKAQKAAKKADSIFSASGVIGRLTELANIDSIEKGFGIISRKKYEDRGDGGKLYFDGYYAGEMNYGTNDSINIVTTINTYVENLVGSVHTHPKTGASPPSAIDIGQLMQSALEDPTNYQGNFVVAAGGDTYYIAVTDSIAASHTQNMLNGSIDYNTHGWREDSEIGKAFDKAALHYSRQYRKDTNKEDLAYEMAMSAILSKFGVGVTLMKKDANGHFKPIMQQINQTINNKGKVIKTDYSDAGC